MRSGYPFACLVGLFCFLFVCLASAQENWPEYRGTDGTGKVDEGSITTDFSDANVTWKVPVPGRAWSSPVVWGDQVWLTTATPDGKKLSALCFDLESGKTIFDIVLHQPQDPGECHGTNTYASSTPAIEAGRIYAHFGPNGTSCLDTATGEILWQREDIKCRHHRGAASSPILSDDLVMFAMDGNDRQYVIALNKQTGETVWQTKREIDYPVENGDRKKAYGTGVIFDINNRQLLVLPTAVATIAYDIKNGEAVWIAYHGGMNSAARPLMLPSGSLLITNGLGKLLVIDPTGQGDVTDSHIKYVRAKVIPDKSTPLIVGDSAFMVSDKGIASCIEAETGKEVWAKRLKGMFDASPVTDGEKILAMNTAGTIYVFKASDTFELLVETEFADQFHASPAAINGDLILRSLTHLYRVGRKTASQ